MLKIRKDFYLSNDVVSFGKTLLGKVLCTKIGNVVTKGIITETEAYNHINDKASHASNGRRTQRNEAMYAIGGTTYVYLCYGMYPLFNVVSNKKNIPDAVLVRGVYIIKGFEHVLTRRKETQYSYKISSGPGRAALAMGINMKHNGISLSGNSIWIEDHCINISFNKDISISPRVGVDYAEEDALLPYNFKIKSIETLNKFQHYEH